jgi:hypothetical protein
MGPESTTARQQRGGSSRGSGSGSPGWPSSTSPPKRYLVATCAGYQAKLTEVSAKTLLAQGGPMSEEEVAAFRAHTDWRLAVKLREIDDRGKVPGAVVPPLDAYAGDVLEVIAARRRSAS